MTIVLDPELQARLCAVAKARGADPSDYATTVLVDAVARDEQDPDANLSEEERAAVRAGLERGLADSAAGRVTPGRRILCRNEPQIRYLSTP
jgi:predicted transcriptional regulator